MRNNGFRRNRRNLIILLVALSVLLCAIVVVSFRMSGDITNSLRESAYDSLMDASEIIRQNIDSDIEDDIRLVSSFGEMLRDTDYKDIVLQLSQLCYVDKLLHAYYADASGVGVSETGARFDKASLPVEETALRGEASVSKGFVGETGQKHIIVQAPIFDEGVVVGALYGEVVATRYFLEDTFIFHDGEGRASLFNRDDGTYVIKAPQTELTDLKSDSIFDSIRQSAGDARLYDEFIEKISAGSKSVIQLRYGSQNSFVAILPCKTNADLYVATIISRQALQGEADTISSLILLMQLILIAGLCGLIGMGSLLLLRMIREEQARKTRELEERSREELAAALVKAQEASVAKSRFLSNMSHDIRTPMNAIIGMTTLAGQSIGDEEKLRDCLSVIASSSRHLMDLINDILDMSRIESGDLTLSREPFALPAAIRSVAAIISPLCRARRQEFSVEFINAEHEYLIGDKTKLNQVLMNLLNNANKFTPEGGRIRLIIEELPAPEPENAAYRFSVVDNGIGIAEKDREKVFESFVRVSDSISGGVEGTGLGLPIAKNIVTAMGGAIELTSEINKGTAFTVTLSFPVQKSLCFKDEYPALRGLRVLIAGKDEETVNRARGYLADAGADAQAAESGDTGIFDMALVDLDMPDCGEMIRSIRRAQTQVIALTGKDSSEVEALSHDAGAEAIIYKPLFRSSLYEGITALKQNRALREKPEPTLSGKRILLVEDHEVNRKVAIRLLEGVGATVDVARDGQEGVELFLNSPEGCYDAILMDIQMPVMDGYEATARIHASRHPNAGDIPIIALTANAFVEDSKRVSAAGMDAYLTKPIVPQALYETLLRLIKR